MRRNQLSSLRVCWLMVCILVSAMGCRTSPSSSSVLDKAEIARLAAIDPSNYGKPVRITGVVTYCDPDWHLLFLQDSSGGFFVDLKEMIPGLATGRLIEVSGKLAPSNRGIDDPEFRLLGSAPMPTPQPLPDAAVTSRARLSQWVELHGTVRASSLEDGRLSLTMVDGTRRTKARILTPQQIPPINFVGAEVHVTGVSAAAVDEKTNTTGIQVFVSSPDQVKLLGAAKLTDPFYSKPEPISIALDRGAAGKLVHLAGTVVEQKPDRVLVVKEGTTKVEALVSDSSQLAAGDNVELLGFTSLSPAYQVEDAIVRVIAPRTPLKESQINGTLRTIRELKSLSVETASKQLPVDVRATVTFVDPAFSLLFVQDETAGAYVDIHNGSRPEVEAGDIVRVRGVSGPGDYAPIIAHPTVTHLGKGPMPKALTLSLQTLASGNNDAAWVEIVGIVHSVSQLINLHSFKLVVAGTSYDVDLPHSANINGIQNGLLDAQVRIGGVCGAVFNEKRQSVGLKFFVPDTKYVEVLEPAPMEATSVRPIITLLRFDPLNLSIHRTTVRGTVTLKDSDRAFYVQDSSAGIYVVAEQKADVQPGQVVEVSGFAVAGTGGSYLEDAAVHVAQEKSQAVPVKLTGEEITTAYRSQLVAVEGRLLDRVDGPESTLILRTGSLVLRARLQGAKISPEVLRGSLLEVIGVLQTDGRTNQNSFLIALPTPGNVRVLQAAPWWTAENAARSLAVVVVAILAALFWMSVKAYRLRSYQAKHDSLTGLPNRGSTLEYLERQLARAVRERTPIGVILADVDHFKKVNDTYGHQAGDAVLEKIAEILNAALRPYDAVGRYGGEEFLLVVPGCDAAMANEIAERIRVRILEEVFTSVLDAKSFHVTCSFGVAIATGARWKMDSALAAADRALYAAKNSGRNRVETAESTAVASATRFPTTY